MRLWRNNRLDQEWEKPAPEIVGEFWVSDYGAKVWAGLRLERALRAFIADRLESVWEEAEFDEVLRLAIRSMPPIDLFEKKAIRLTSTKLRCKVCGADGWPGGSWMDDHRRGHLPCPDCGKMLPITASGKRRGHRCPVKS